MLINNDDLLKKINTYDVRQMLSDSPEHLLDLFKEDFIRRFSWNSNKIEGNTLSLDDVVALVDFDEVRSGHTYQEYSEARLTYDAIVKYLSFEFQMINEDWIKGINSLIDSRTPGYRNEERRVGNLIETVYYPPNPALVPDLMNKFIENYGNPKDIVSICKSHLEFEMIHPFFDKNGRTGRLILNQQLINIGLLPITFLDTAKYMQAFRKYENNKDYSVLLHIILKSEIESIERYIALNEGYSIKQNNFQNELMKDKDQDIDENPDI